MWSRKGLIKWDVKLPLSCFKIRSILLMKPKGKSTGELTGKRFLTTKIKRQEETVSFSFGCCYNWMWCQEELQTLCYQLDDTKNRRVEREREKKIGPWFFVWDTDLTNPEVWSVSVLPVMWNSNFSYCVCQFKSGFLLLAAEVILTDVEWVLIALIGYNKPVCKF